MNYLKRLKHEHENFLFALQIGKISPRPTRVYTNIFGLKITSIALSQYNNMFSEYSWHKLSSSQGPISMQLPNPNPRGGRIQLVCFDNIQGQES